MTLFHLDEILIDFLRVLTFPTELPLVKEVSLEGIFSIYTRFQYNLMVRYNFYFLRLFFSTKLESAARLRFY